MLENNNLAACRLLIRRDLKFHSRKSLLLGIAVSLMTAMYAFVFLLGSSIEGAYLLSYQYAYGSTNHILFTGMTSRQAQAVAGASSVKSAVWLSTIGTLSDEMIGSRSVKLAVTDWDYAETVLSLPTDGRMPEDPAEIALDAFTMDSLGLPHQLGYAFTLQWTDPAGRVHDADFILSGWWQSPTNFTEACAWITPERAAALLPGYREDTAANVSLGVNLYWPDDLAAQAQALLADQGISGPGFTVNLGCLDARMDAANSKARPFYSLAILVLVCGFLMVYSILHVTGERERRYFAGLKMLGTTPRQIRYILLGQASLLTLPALPAGLLLGGGSYYLFVPRIITGFAHHPASYLMDWPPLLLAAGCSWATVLLAYLPPMGGLARRTPRKLLDEDSLRRGGRREAGQGQATLALLALRSLRRNTGHAVLSAASLLIALVILCGSWTIYSSYSEEMYLSAVSPWDYTIADGSACITSQRYNEKNQNITQEMVSALAGRPEVLSVSGLKSHELTLTASPELRQLLLDFYNGIDPESGVPRRELMNFQPEWSRGLEAFENTGEYTALVLGADSAFWTYFTQSYPLIDGSFDAEQFAQGGYVLTGGSYTSELCSLPAGAEVELAGQTFAVMAAVVADETVISGGNSPQAAFRLLYCLPTEAFDRLFPGQAYRQLAVDIDHSRQETFETFLSGYEQGVNSGIAVKSRSDYQENFENARLNAVVVDLLIGGVLLLIGLLNVVNAMVTKIVTQKKEFAIYESLGMTVDQLRRLLALESALYGAILLSVVSLGTFLLTWFGLPVVFAGMNTWCMTYRYTLTPLWCSIPALVILALAAPQLALGWVRRDSLTERMRVVE